MNSKQLREKVAREGYHRAKKYSWARCADETFDLFNIITSNFQKTNINSNDI